MAYNPEQVHALNRDYSATTGRAVELFVCPITLGDDAKSRLCDGHILNKSIATASRKTVPQYERIDNFYGSQLEAEFVNFINTPLLKPHELMKRARSLDLTLPSGEKMEGFVPGKSAAKGARTKFPQLNLLDPSGKTVAAPFLRTDRLEDKLHKGVLVEWELVLNRSVLLGAMLKSAFLTLFRLGGYRYVLSSPGARVREPLAAFYNDRAEKNGADAYFSAFEGAVKLLAENYDSSLNTLDSGLLWRHYERNGRTTGLDFAATCLFSVNARVFGVTVPYYDDAERSERALECYDAMLKDPAYLQDVHRWQILDDRQILETVPLSVRHG
jgi:hypothetical protein